MNQLENCQAWYRSNTWMGRTRTDGPHECILVPPPPLSKAPVRSKAVGRLLLIHSLLLLPVLCFSLSFVSIFNIVLPPS